MISFRHMFVFIANLKSASTAIETVLAPVSEIALTEARFGKHLSLSDVEQRFDWLFQEVPLSDFFVFGIMRDPIDLVVSLFNSHADERFRSTPHLFTGNMDFDTFISVWCVRNSDQLAEQHTRLLTKEGSLGANLVIPYERLAQGLQVVASRIGVADLGGIPTVNASNRRISRDDLTPDHIAGIRRRFAGDELPPISLDTDLSDRRQIW